MMAYTKPLLLLLLLLLPLLLFLGNQVVDDFNRRPALPRVYLSLFIAVPRVHLSLAIVVPHVPL